MQNTTTLYTNVYRNTHSFLKQKNKHVLNIVNRQHDLKDIK